MNVIEKGFDASWGWPDLQAAWNAGYRFVCGYLSRDASKNWTPARVADARRIGFDLLFNWETTVDAYAGGFAQGVADARQANDEADLLGVPGNVWVWYSVDTGATADQVRAYFQGIGSVGRRLAGGYGGIEMDTLLHEGLIKGWWQANAGSWSGYNTSTFPTHPDAGVRQIVGHTVNAGGSTDEDWLYSTNGLWLAHAQGAFMALSDQQQADMLTMVSNIHVALFGEDVDPLDSSGAKQGVHWEVFKIAGGVAQIRDLLTQAHNQAQASGSGSIDVEALASKVADVFSARLAAKSASS